MGGGADDRYIFGNNGFSHRAHRPHSSLILNSMKGEAHPLLFGKGFARALGIGYFASRGLLRDAFPLRSPRGPLQRTALRKKLINQLLCFWLLCLQVNLRHTIQKQKVSNFRHLFALFVLCGEKGIRTPETLLTFTRFPGGPVQPLLHLSFLGRQR